MRHAVAFRDARHLSRRTTMLNELVGQYLKSTDGSGLMKELQAKGLTEQQAAHGITATAEGAINQQPEGAGGPSTAGALGGLAGMLGGGGLAGMLGGGGLAGMLSGGGLAGMLGGAPAAGAPAAPGGVSPLAQIVAQKTGLAPLMAEVVVAAVLPRLKAMLMGPPAGAPAEGAAPAAPAAGAADLLGSLFR
jgi:hypothetical protein